MKLNKNIQFFAPPPAVIDSNITGWLNNDNTDTMNLAFSSADSSGTISLSADGKTITFSVFNDEYKLNSNIQNNGIYSNGVLTLNTPIMAIYSDTAFSSVLLNRGETKSYPLTYNCYVKWETSPQTILDLSTLSDIADGTHTVKVKAKAEGYNDSEFSNEVSYTKAPAGQKITTLSINDEASWKDAWDIYIKFDGVASPTNYDARFKNEITSGSRDKIYYNGVWSAEHADVTVDITATQWSAYVAEQQYTNYVWPCANDSSLFKTVSPSTNGILYPMGRDNNKFLVMQPAD